MILVAKVSLVKTVEVTAEFTVVAATDGTLILAAFCGWESGKRTGEDNTTRTTRANAIPSPAFITGLSGNLTCFSCLCLAGLECKY